VQIKGPLHFAAQTVSRAAGSYVEVESGNHEPCLGAESHRHRRQRTGRSSCKRGHTIRLSGARYRYRGLGRDPEVDRYVLRKWQEEWEKQSTAVSYRRLEPVVGQRERFRFGSRTAETTAHRLRFVKCAVNAVLYTRHAQARHWAVRPLRGTGDGPAFFAGMLERFSGWRETAVRHLQAAAHDRSSARRRSDTAIHLQNGRSSSVTSDLTETSCDEDSATVYRDPAFRDGHLCERSWAQAPSKQPCKTEAWRVSAWAAFVAASDGRRCALRVATENTRMKEWSGDVIWRQPDLEAKPPCE
jgi:hypothetical protein